MRVNEFVDLPETRKEPAGGELDLQLAGRQKAPGLGNQVVHESPFIYESPSVAQPHIIPSL
jgi:hypothetical protein